jgi:UDP-glucose 4-epimerase
MTARRQGGRARGPILVTGGAGFIGSHLVERLLADGESVVVIDDLSTGQLGNLRSVARHPQLRFLRSRVGECRSLPRIVAGARAIYHLAAAVGVDLVLRSPLRALRTNLHETETVLLAASRYGVPVLLASSSEVYGRGGRAPLAEDDDLALGPPVTARWSYACSKLAGEFLALSCARELRLPVVIARLFNTVGPRQTGRYGMVLPRFIAAARSGRPLRVFGDGRQRRCFCHVADTVEALVRLMRCPAARGQIVNVGSDTETSIVGLARRVLRRLGSASRIQFIPYSRAYAPGFEDLPRRRPSLRKLKALTGFAPRTGLDATIDLTAGQGI